MLRLVCIISLLTINTSCATYPTGQNKADVKTSTRLIHGRSLMISDFTRQYEIDCLTESIAKCPNRFCCSDTSGTAQNLTRPVIYRPAKNYSIDLTQDIYVTIGLSVNPQGRVVATTILDNPDTLAAGYTKIQENIHSYRFTEIDSTDCLEHGIIKISIVEKSN